MVENYYEILGIESNATEEQIKKAFRINAVRYHPDKNFGDTKFTGKFIEIKKAYDTLIDTQKRAEYDLIYKQYFTKPENKTNYDTANPYVQQQKTEQQRQQEEKFRYDPYKQFYSVYDRELQDTPQFNPIFDMWGEKLPEWLDFFKLPKRIGKIIFGLSDLSTEGKPLTSKRKNANNLIALAIGLAIGTAIFFLASLTNPLWIGIWFIVPTCLSLFISYVMNSFIHTNLYVGVNGFALFTCKNSRENITEAIEVNFNDMTDLYVYYVEHSRNFVYQGTSFAYTCLNRNTKEVIFVKGGEYNKKHDIKEQGDTLNFCRRIEHYWTIYLLDRLEQDIQEKGYISFALYSSEDNTYQEYIKLGIGYITFIKSKGQEFTYKFNDIKKMYSRGNELHIQHKNFERTLFFFKSGNEDVIPMLNLCNRQFFYKAMEILLGYSIG